MQILLVEDDFELSSRLCARLSLAGFQVRSTPNAEMAVEASDGAQFAAAIVDLGLPGMSGLDLIRTWRSRGLDMPILILSARGSWQEKVDGLNAGGDDYVVKPIRAEEVSARLHALTRRAAGYAASRMRASNIELDPQSKAAWIDGEPLDLTQMEYRLLHLFILNAGSTLSQQEIHKRIYPEACSRDPNTVEVHIGRLRRKIGHEAIATVRGMGYRLQR